MPVTIITSDRGTIANLFIGLPFLCGAVGASTAAFFRRINLHQNRFLQAKFCVAGEKLYSRVGYVEICDRNIAPASI
jgi:hypothetical protein